MTMGKAVKKIDNVEENVLCAFGEEKSIIRWRKKVHSQIKTESRRRKAGSLQPTRLAIEESIVLMIT